MTTEKLKSMMDTVLVTPQLLEQWKIPPFQRPLKENTKVIELAGTIKETKVLPGVITIGILNEISYIVDGQHRTRSFTLSGVEEAYADARIIYFETIQQMAEEFVKLNGQLVTMTPDDRLRAFETSSSALSKIREKCSFIGYDSIRRNGNGKMLGMSLALKSWKASAADIPSSGGRGPAIEIVSEMAETDVDNFCEALNLFMIGFGVEPEYWKLWGGLNVTLVMWLYRRLVLRTYSQKIPRMDKELFTKCLMSLSADKTYLDWLVGRSWSDGNRSPAYGRIKTIFANRLFQETGKKGFLPQPEWAKGR